MKCMSLFLYLLSSTVIAQESVTTNNVDLFWSLSSTAWSAISSILTLLAIVAAIILPFLIDQKKRRNITQLITEELNQNIKLLKGTREVNAVKAVGRSLTREELIVVMVRSIELDIWNNHKNLLAEISAKKYKEYLVVNNLLERIHSGGRTIEEKKGRAPYLIAIFKDIERCIALTDE